MQHDPVVGSGDLHAPGPRRESNQTAQEPLRFRAEIPPDLDQRNDLPIGREAGVEPPERVGDPAPLFYRRGHRVASVDLIPDQRPYNTDFRHSTRDRPWPLRTPRPYPTTHRV